MKKIPNAIIEKYTNLGFKPSQIQKCKEAFDLFDIDNSNFIELKELRLALENMGHKPTEEELYDMMTQVEKIDKNEKEDPNSEPRISFEEFMSIILKQKLKVENEMREDIVNSFKALGGTIENEGEEGERLSGTINLDKVKKIINDEFEMEIDMSKLIMQFDEDGNKEIQFSEFMDLMSS